MHIDSCGVGRPSRFTPAAPLQPPPRPATPAAPADTFECIPGEGAVAAYDTRPGAARHGQTTQKGMDAMTGALAAAGGAEIGMKVGIAVAGPGGAVVGGLVGGAIATGIWAMTQ
ncbi:MAG TPA: hypothetical protein VFH51_10375 [Myxococcota bacterium]|nr:hypothetical protein [Myxococcota bacterium]